MNKLIVLFIALLLCFASFVACDRSKSHHPDYTRDDVKVSPLKARIALTQTAVKNNETFSVSTTLINSGSKVWELAVGCGFLDEWNSDNPSIHVIGEACMKFIPVGVRLKSGETYERAVPVRLVLMADKGQSEKVTFRLRFNDPTFIPHPEVPPVWSNAVTINVAR